MHIGQLPLRAAAATAVLVAVPVTTVLTAPPATAARADTAVHGCRGRAVAAHTPSPAVASPAGLAPAAAGRESAVRAETRSRPTVRPGPHPERVACYGRAGEAEEVRGAGKADEAQEAGDAGAAPARTDTRERPAGTDSATRLAAQPELAGPGARHAVTGLALAAVAAVAVTLRGARRRA